MSSGELGRTLAPGDYLVRQGEEGQCMYVIQEGQAEIVLTREGAPVRLGIRGPGDIVGEMAIFERERRVADVRALTRLRVLTVDRKNFLQRVREDPTVAFRVVEQMSRRLRALSEEIGQLKGARPE